MRRVAIRNPSDLVQAFRARALRDERRILRIEALLRASTDRTQVSELLVSLEDIAHGLAGAGGVFGFDSVSEAALRVELQVERWRHGEMEWTPRRRTLLTRTVGALVAALRGARQPYSLET
jgi:chemotaxis protein histidine kinase CheA